MPDIAVSVDAATLSKWQTALAILRRSYAIPLTFLPPVQVSPPPPALLLVTGERLLLEVGRASSRLEILDDPGRLFALLKYGLALSDKQPDLTLIQPYRRLDTHKKKVLSDDFGCGAALLAASELFNASDFLDFQTGIARGWVTTKANTARQPDFVGLTATGGLVVLEAKGTQKGAAYARGDQIASGCGQVAAAQIAGPNAPQIDMRLVSAISLSFDDSPGTRLFLGDPEGTRADTYEFTEHVQRTCRRLHYLRVAAFLGDVTLADSLLGRNSGMLASPMVRWTIGQVPYLYLGTSITVNEGRRRRLVVFAGLATAVRDALLSGDLDTLHKHPTASSGATFLLETPVVHDGADRNHLLDLNETFSSARDGTAWVTWRDS